MRGASSADSIAACAGADEGLDLGVRARLAGARVVARPDARSSPSAGDGVAGLPEPLTTAAARAARAFAARAAQLHRRLAYAPPLAVAVALAVAPAARRVAHARAARRASSPGSIAPGMGGGRASRPCGSCRRRARAGASRAHAHRVVGAARPAADDAGRSCASASTTIPRSRSASHRRSDLRFFTGGGAWLVLAALVVSVAAFPALLAWPVLGGGALQPLRDDGRAAVGRRRLRAARLGTRHDRAGRSRSPRSSPSLGSLWPWEPSRALVLLWVLALPLAALGGWFAATRVTERSSLRLAGGAVWALAPTLLAALTQGRPDGACSRICCCPGCSTPGRSRIDRGSRRRCGIPAARRGARLRAVARARARWCCGSARVVLAVVLPGRARRRAARVAAHPGRSRSRAPLVWHAAARMRGRGGSSPIPACRGRARRSAADAAGRALLAAGIPTSDLGGMGGAAAGRADVVGAAARAPLALLALARAADAAVGGGHRPARRSPRLGIATAFAAVGVSVSLRRSRSPCRCGREPG